MHSPSNNNNNNEKLKPWPVNFQNLIKTSFAFLSLINSEPKRGCRRCGNYKKCLNFSIFTRRASCFLEHTLVLLI